MTKFISNTVFTVVISSFVALSANADEGKIQASSIEAVQSYTLTLLPVAQRKLSEFEAEIETIEVEKSVQSDSTTVQNQEEAIEQSLWALNY